MAGLSRVQKRPSFPRIQHFLKTMRATLAAPRTNYLSLQSTIDKGLIVAFPSWSWRIGVRNQGPKSLLERDFNTLLSKSTTPVPVEEENSVEMNGVNGSSRP